MPHIIVKWYPGRSDARKEELAHVTTRKGAPEAWAETDYQPDILEKEATLILKPSYDPFVKTDK